MTERLLEVLPDADAVARRAAELIASRGRAAVAERGGFSLGLSGGRQAASMVAALADDEMPWGSVTVYQVDERVAPAGHPDRNLRALEDLPARTVPMPVEADDLQAAAERYAAELPDRLDLVHLGLGPDGHTASLVPGDPVLEIHDRDVALTREHRGRVRMTLTYPVLDRAREAVWVVTGDDKREALAKLLAGDTSIPGGRVHTPVQTVLADAAAAGERA